MAFENFKKKKFSEIIAQATTKKKEAFRKIPAVLRLGKKTTERKGFFDYNGVILDALDKSRNSPDYEDNSVLLEEDPSTGEVSVLIKDTVFKKNFFKHIDQTLGFSVQAKTQISKSFFDQIGTAVSNMPPEERYVQILAAPNEVGSSNDDDATGIFGPVTASLNVIRSLGWYSASLERKLTFENNSINFYSTAIKWSNMTTNSSQSAITTALVNAGSSSFTRSFDEVSSYYIQPTAVPLTTFSSTGNENGYNLISLTSSFSSSNTFGHSSSVSFTNTTHSTINTVINYNGQNGNDGEFVRDNFKGYITGEANDELDFNLDTGQTSTSVKSFLQGQDIISYKSKTLSNIRSASFYYTPYTNNTSSNHTERTNQNVLSASRNTASSDLTTLYWLEHSYTSSFVGEFRGGLINKHSQRTQTNNGGTFQLPFMPADNYANDREGRSFGSLLGGSYLNPSGSHLWKDVFLSQTADEGYYIHTQSIALLESNQADHKQNLQALQNNGALSQSIFIYGVFKQASVTAGGSLALSVLNPTGSQQDESRAHIESCPRVTNVFIKEYLNNTRAFFFNPEVGGFAGGVNFGTKAAIE